MKLRNFCKFKIKGLNQEKMVNELSKKFTIFDYKRIDKNISSFKVKFFSGKKIEEFLKQAGFEILLIEKRGALNFLFKGLISYGLISGCLIGGIFCFVQNFFVRNVEVWGNERISERDVVCLVKDNIGNGFKGSLDLNMIENKVYSEFSNLSFVSVSLVGQTIIVNIKEEIIPDEMKRSFDPIYSDYDGKISKIELIQGTLAVKIGDIVQNGQILVYPYIQDSNGNQMPVKPIANIEAEVWIEGKIMHNSYFKETYRTGKKITENEVYLGKLKVYQKKSELKFNEFEVIEQIKELSKNNIMPFVLKTKTYYEIATRVVQESFESVKDDIISKARENALQKLEDCDIIKNEDYIIRQAGNISEVIYVITVSKKVGG